MALYRHATNLRVPFSLADMEFLLALVDYRIGEPVEPPPRKEQGEPYNAADLVIGGVVGVYTTKAALKSPLVLKKTRWSESIQLGRPWRPLGKIDVIAPLDAAQVSGDAHDEAA